MQKSSKDVKIGAKFGRWTVLEIDVINPKSTAKKPPKMALCKCECGTQRYKEYRDLYSGRSLSCGCLRAEQLTEKNCQKGEIEIGTQFGCLTVIQDLGYRKQNSRNKRARWSLCQCSCGTKIEVSNNNLRSGNTKSCGCVNSFGENEIRKLLIKNNINFATEYIFNDLKGTRGGHLRFDFAIFDNNNQLIELIEFDGRQHFEGPDGIWTQSYSKEIIEENDNRKNEYCKKHNIKLVRIPYYQLSKLSLDLLGLEN